MIAGAKGSGMTAPPARLLDLTRLTTRAGRVLTGVDRVELAYAEALSADPVPCFGLVSTPLGALLLDRAGVAALARAARSGDWGHPGPVARAIARGDGARAAGQALARRHAVARAPRAALGRMLRRRLPPGFAWINVGHANLTRAAFAAMRSLAGTRIAVMIHDTIPLDFPGFQRPGTVDDFAAKFARAIRMADLILTPSEASARDIARHAAPLGRLPPVLVAPNGVTPAPPDPAALPPGLDLRDPWFVTLGTIEPRKNHALLLDVWERLGPDPPRLFICGSRGWRNETVFARLDARPRGVTELAGLPDGAVAALVAGARGFLFPSLAEGFGLPPIEAAALGVPVLCGDLAIWRETLGEGPVYLDPTDVYQWTQAVGSLLAGPVPQRRPPRPPQTWAAHFKVVLAAT